MLLAAGGSGLSLPEWVGIVTGALIAGAAVWPRVENFLGRSGLRTTATSTMKIYEENNQALQQQNDLRQREIKDLKAELEAANRQAATQDKRIGSLQQQIANLQEMVLQVKAISDLQNQMSHMETRFLDRLDDSHSQLAGLITANTRAIKQLADGQTDPAQRRPTRKEGTG